jgi:hypothetical protein
MRKFLATGGALAVLALAATSANAAQLITNGDFATGDFTGWTLFTTANGTTGPGPAPQVTSFDVTGSGASLAAEFEVGEAVFSGAQEGGGIRQSITTTAGMLTFSTDFAARAAERTNASGGVFSVLLDGVSLATFNTGEIAALSVERGTLAFATTVTAGSHLLSLQMTRPFTVTTSTGGTPYQYFDNVSATQAAAAAPEPATWGLMIAGFGLAGGALRRRARTAIPA